MSKIYFSFNRAVIRQKKKYKLDIPTNLRAKIGTLIQPNQLDYNKKFH
jgi:hypothetical protein